MRCGFRVPKLCRLVQSILDHSEESVISDDVIIPRNNRISKLLELLSKVVSSLAQRTLCIVRQELFQFVLLDQESGKISVYCEGPVYLSRSQVTSEIVEAGDLRMVELGKQDILVNRDTAIVQDLIPVSDILASE